MGCSSVMGQPKGCGCYTNKAVEFSSALLLFLLVVVGATFIARVSGKVTPPSTARFQWSTALSWGSTWSFLFTSIAFYIASSASLYLLLLCLQLRLRPVPLDRIAALHSLLMAFLSATIFAGILVSAVSEIQETQWFWRRSKTPLQWLLCFPLGTRPSGRVFFWLYAFYLSRFLRLLCNYFTVLRRRHLSSCARQNNSEGKAPCPPLKTNRDPQIAKK